VPLAILHAADAPDSATKPNIIYLLVDDMGYADTGFNGCQDIRTPSIDKLAKQGAILDDFYAQPVCSPGRAALLTGRYPMHTGIYNVVNPQGKGLRGPLPLTERTLAQALREAGYTTAICGKWHLGSDAPEYKPTKRGFESQYGLYGGALNYFTHAAGDKKIGAIDWYRNDIACADTGYTTHLIAKEACRIIRAQPPDKPFFLYVAPNAVHGPLDSPEEYKEPYANLSKHRMELAGATAALDDDIGRIMATLAEKGMISNTLVIYSSDNGGPSWNNTCQNGPLRGGKSDIYEGGFRVCAFATWPGKIPAGIHVKEPVHVVDWFPTLCKLAGASLTQPFPLDGFDIWPVLTQGAKSPHDAIPLIGSRDGQYAIRVGDWKLLINPAEFKRNVKCSPVELYNLAEDVGEKNNLADSQPERVKEMRASLDAMIANPVNPEFFNRKEPSADKTKTRPQVDEPDVE
jgi:arylsulfatase A-like enzyme